MTTQLIVSMYGDIVAQLSPSLRDWWDEMEAWATKLRVPPNKIWAEFEQKPKGLIGDNAYTLARYRSRFIRQLDVANIRYLRLVRVWAEGGDCSLDWDFCGLYGPDRCAGAMFTVGVSLERLHCVPGASARDFSREAAHRGGCYLRTKYGFAVAMPRLFMSGGYAIGLASGELPEEMIDDCNAWSRFSGKECDRTLRNVYGYNVLNAKHLDMAVGDRRLEDWIRASGDRGHIEPLGDGLFLWTFQEGDDQEAFLNWDYPPVVQVREELKQHEIFPWQKFRRQLEEPLR